MKGSKIKFTVVGAAEAHLLAKEIAEADVGIVFVPSRPFPYNWQSKRMYGTHVKIFLSLLTCFCLKIARSTSHLSQCSICVVSAQCDSRYWYRRSLEYKEYPFRCCMGKHFLASLPLDVLSSSLALSSLVGLFRPLWKLMETSHKHRRSPSPRQIWKNY